MAEVQTANSRAARHFLLTAWTGLDRLRCAETTANRVCGAFNTITRHAGMKGEQKYTVLAGEG